jgi:hypothetical protein
MVLVLLGAPPTTPHRHVEGSRELKSFPQNDAHEGSSLLRRHSSLLVVLGNLETRDLTVDGTERSILPNPCDLTAPQWK